MIDGDGSTRWATGQGQTPGQYVLLDFGHKRSMHRLDIDSGDNLGDYARSYSVEESLNGLDWTTVAEDTNTAQLITVRAHMVARYLRITNTGSAGNWWSIARDPHLPLRGIPPIRRGPGARIRLAAAYR